MDLKKLHNQLLKEYIGFYPDNFHHLVTISAEITNNSITKETYSTFQISFYSRPVKDVFKGDESHFLITKKTTSLKKAVEEARNLLLPIDNKPEVETDLKSIKP